VVVTREDTWRLKPHPEPIRYAAGQLGVAIERCLMVGDTGVDVRAAKAAGARAVGVLCGFGERGDLAGADLILESPAELGEWLKESLSWPSTRYPKEQFVHRDGGHTAGIIAHSMFDGACTRLTAFEIGD
jgi:ribonucleotide monophosphatase NagD (HAD superfamily)